ncbi:unnamed protein product [Durusdinium trenchii]|uniref:Imidazole glycerol phosphate synthase hisHF n=1 Tax=Durusdinium trenchii TaxID=1381693 RepID=A0ABP0HH07_9DINO
MEPLRQYLKEDRPFFGICLGMQTLFEGSEESPGVPGLGLLPGLVRRFPTTSLAVPNINWSGVAPMRLEPWPLEKDQPRCYFVHSYRVPMPEGAAPWALACSEYGETFVCAVRQGRCVATQFHPEKSGTAGLKILQSWLQGSAPSGAAAEAPAAAPAMPAVPARRIIACLDVRSNDAGDLVVTKGDQYDVREKGEVRNHGKPVALAERYYQDGADEVSFLNITAFRDMVLTDQPMLEVLRLSAERIFVPLTVGGGIRGPERRCRWWGGSYVDAKGQSYSALEVADAYFRAGADKISIGSDAVEVARAFYAAGRKARPMPGGDGSSSIELISTKYGRQAVVISVDPRRVYVPDAAAAANHAVVELKEGTPKGPKGEGFAWYCCTVKGGRDLWLDGRMLAQAVEALGAGELLLNCIDRDGQGTGYELELINQVKTACTLPVIASSGAGTPEHFEEALATGADAALAAGIFHREEVESIVEATQMLVSDRRPLQLMAAVGEGSLNPYAGGRWKIKARVLTKSDIRKFNNSRGEGQLFKVDLKDQSGEMSATFFGRAVDKYHGMLKPGQVYTFTRGQVKTANKRYDTGDFVLTFEESGLSRGQGGGSERGVRSYEFRPLCDVAALAPEALVDVKAAAWCRREGVKDEVIYSVPPPFTFVAKTSNREMTKREIGLWDPSGPAGYSTMELTLWNESALGSDFQVGQVAFLKKARVTEFNQQKSLGSPAQLDLNPDHPDRSSGTAPFFPPVSGPTRSFASTPHVDHRCHG